MTETIAILIVLTSHDALGDSGRKTGLWFEELAEPYYAFVDAGARVDLASMAGGKVPIDPHSLHSSGNPPSVDRFLKDKEAMRKLEASLRVDSVSGERYSAIFLPGGHGTMWDLPESASLAALLTTAWRDGKVLAAVCHGPAGLLNVRDATGRPLVAGKRVSAFTDAEEAAVGLAQVVPFALETRLRGMGARFESGPNFGIYTVRDGKLITGQNPASSAEVARLTLEAVTRAPV